MTRVWRLHSLFCVCVISVQLIGLAQKSSHAFGAGQADKNQKSLQAFRAVASVLSSPRCLNCYVPGDGPLQDDDDHPHTMNVKRGPDGKGSTALHCAACHQAENTKVLHGPPGAADWQLPPQRTPMAWKGLSMGELCRTLKDP